MYALRNLLDKNPIQIAAAVVAVLNVFIIIGVLTCSAEAVAGVNVALVAVLSLFVVSKTVNSAKLHELADGDDGAVTVLEVLVVLILVCVVLLVFGWAPR